MSMPNSLRAYADCEALYDQALADPKGARACLGTENACITMRTRMHYFRKLDRQAAEEIYPHGDPKHGTSRYDDLSITIAEDTEGDFWLYIQPRSARVLEVQGLSQLEDEADATS